MLYTVVEVMLVLWLLGLVTSYTMGGFMYMLAGTCHYHGAGQCY